jgi:hypothetical protein
MALLSTRTAAPVMLLLALSACNADRSRFPSLATRPAERAYGTGQPVTPTDVLPLTAQVPASASLAARVSALRKTARAAHARFGEQQGEAARLVAAARGSTPGTDAWARATVALAALTSARSEGMVALADLDRLLIAATEQAATGSDADLAAVSPAHSEVEALLKDEDQTVTALSEAIRG